MPSNRSVLADITDLGLDHRTPHRGTSATGRLKVYKKVDAATGVVTEVTEVVTEEMTTETPAVEETVVVEETPVVAETTPETETAPAVDSAEAVVEAKPRKGKKSTQTV